MSNKFTPTHEIALTDRRDGKRRWFQVMLIDGAAYTREEYEADAPADWECDLSSCTPDEPSRGWTFQGGAYPNHTVSVRALAPHEVRK